MLEGIGHKFLIGRKTEIITDSTESKKIKQCKKHNAHIFAH
jgi:hypothetical protein